LPPSFRTERRDERKRETAQDLKARPGARRERDAEGKRKGREEKRKRRKIDGIAGREAKAENTDAANARGQERGTEK